MYCLKTIDNILIITLYVDDLIISIDKIQKKIQINK